MCTLGYYGSKDLLADRIEYFSFVVFSEELVDVRKSVGHWLLEYPQRYGDGLEIFCSCCNVNIDGFKSGIVDDGVLTQGSSTSMKGILRL